MTPEDFAAREEMGEQEGWAGSSTGKKSKKKVQHILQILLSVHLYILNHVYIEYLCIRAHQEWLIQCS